MYSRSMKTVSDIIDKWPRTRDFALDIGVEWMTAHQWRRRGSIPPQYWGPLVKAAKRRGYPITEKTLIDMASARRRNDRQAVSA